MQNNNSIIQDLVNSIEILEKELDSFIIDNKVKTQQIKKLYKENDMLKKKYRIILEKISKYTEELNTLKKDYGKD
jgi:hypothetical protein